MYKVVKKEETQARKCPPELPKNIRKDETRVFPKLSTSEVLTLIKEKCGPVETEKFGRGNDKVIILPGATKELYSLIYWGERTPTNTFEQIYQGMGHIFEKDGIRTVVISHFLYIYAAERTPVSACISNGVYDSIMKRIEYERQIYNRNERICNKTGNGFLFDPFVNEYDLSEVVLYGHTHPGLGCFFSQPDKTSGYATPNLPAVTFVADPIRKDMKAIVGIEEQDAQIIVFEYSQQRIEKAGKKTYHSVEIEELLSEIGRDCNDILNPLYGVKGKYKSYRTISGAQRIKFDMKWRPNKKTLANQEQSQIKKAGVQYESYA